MTWYAIYDTTNGNLLVSVGTVVANPLPSGLASLALTAQPDFSTQQWNPANTSFVAIPPSTQPNVSGFRTAMMAVFNNDPSQMTAMAQAYPLFDSFVLAQNWPGVQWCITDANSKSRITSTQYTAIKSAVSANNIPVTLP